MGKGAPSSLFVNDGSFMERFKQLQQEQEKEKEKAARSGDSAPVKIVSETLASKSSSSKANNTPKTTQTASGGKLAFSLKQKSKLVPAPVNLAVDEDEDEADAQGREDTTDVPVKRQKLGQADSFEQVSGGHGVAPSPSPSSPSDPTVKNVADKLASFVAKNGRQFEDVTRQKNPGDTPFKFLFDRNCAEYKYYEHRLAQEEKDIAQNKEGQTSHTGSASISSSRLTSNSQRSTQQHTSYQIPASALYEDAQDSRASGTSLAQSVQTDAGTQSHNDSLAMMEFYMKKAAQEEKRKQPKQSKDEMPPPPSLLGPGKKGHHMGDFIPQEELESFLASCNDVASQKAAREAAERAKIQADNVGHKLLSKMGWKEGEGLGSSSKGMSDPIMAGGIKNNNLGVGAHNPGEVTPEDDIYEQYKKRMMLGYRHRPNPLNNPRKAYY